MRKVGPGGPSAGGSMVKVVIWRDTCEAVDQGDAIAAWLCTFLELVSHGGGGGKGYIQFVHGRSRMI